MKRRNFLKEMTFTGMSVNITPVLMGFNPTNQLRGNNNNKISYSDIPDLKLEIQRTKPDYIVYVPKSANGSTFDNGNEHFLVFPGTDGSLMAIWTQSTVEGHGDHRILFSKSSDRGRTWAEPVFLAGVKPGDGVHISVPTGEWTRPANFLLPQASWAFPMVTKRGRIYVAYNQYHGVGDVHPQFTGTMDAVFSDDHGKTWSSPQTIPMKRSKWDHSDPSVPPNWIVWQSPVKDLKGRWFTGFTRWISTDVRLSPSGIQNYRTPAVIEFMRFENLEKHPEPRNIKVSWFASDDKALKVPHPFQPALSVAEEPSIVRLPDKRLFCVFRTMTNYIWYSVSDTDGETWTAARPLLDRDHGTPMISPIFCTTMYQLPDGKYILFHHPAYRTPELKQKYNVPDEHVQNRRPAFIALGEYRKGADQPVWFSKSKFFMDNDGVPLGPRARIDVGGYPSLTTQGGEIVLWHPDRKFFLLGKIITKEFLSDLKVPSV